jgi:hypothetical protein
VSLIVESPEYRSALRAVSQVSGADGGVSRPKLTIEELEGVITPEVCLFLIDIVDDDEEDDEEEDEEEDEDEEEEEGK